MTCKDCQGFEWCKKTNPFGGYQTEYYDEECCVANVETECDKFQDKSKIIKLPCKVGDTVYRVNYIYKCDTCKRNHLLVKCANIQDYCSTYINQNGGCDRKSKIWITEEPFEIQHNWSIYTRNFYYNVFLTKEEAEAKLKELNR